MTVDRAASSSVASATYTAANESVKVISGVGGHGGARGERRTGGGGRWGVGRLLAVGCSLPCGAPAHHPRHLV